MANPTAFLETRHADFHHPAYKRRSQPSSKGTIDEGFQSSSIAFEIAAKAAYRQTMVKCAPQILEPMMKLDVFTPEEKVGDVIGDLNRRRGMIQGQEPTPGGVRVKAEAPLSAMFGSIGDLRTMPSGCGQFSMEFSHYAQCCQDSSEESEN